MLYALAICCAMIGDDGKPAKTPPADLSTYESARAKVGKDANANVRLALWCEEHGLSAERVKHLALAVAQDPANGLCAGYWAWLPTTGNGEGLRKSGNVSMTILPTRTSCASTSIAAPRRPTNRIRSYGWPPGAIRMD